VGSPPDPTVALESSGEIFVSIGIELHSAATEFRAELSASEQRTFDRSMVYLRSSGLASRALRVGEYAPDFDLVSNAGDIITLGELIRSGPVVMSFYWGGWSRCCTLYLSAFQEAVEEFAAAGARVVAVSAERSADLRATAHFNRLDFDLLSDPDGKVARLFGLSFRLPDELRGIFSRLGVDIAAYTTTNDLTLPLPATYVFDGEGIATYAHVDPDPMRRPDPKVVLSEIRRLTGVSAMTFD
jgi:peroxiredoxin